MLIVHALGNENKNVKNFSRGILLLYAITVVLSILVTIISVALGASVIETLFG